VGLLRRTAADLGAAEAVPPPAHLKGRVLSAVNRTAQPSAADQGVDEAQDTSPPVPAPAAVTPLRSRTSWRTWVAAAAAAVVVIVGGAVGVRELLAGSDEATLAGPAATVFGAKDARTATVRTRNGGSLTVGVSPSLDEMAVDTRGLPPLDARHVYQIWAVHDGRMTSAAVLTDPDGGAAMALPGPGTEVALTVEPEPGSRRPTTDPIVQVDPGAV
jgi:hypothetical protein